MSNTTVQEPATSFGEYYKQYARLKLTGRTTFRHPEYNQKGRLIAGVFYPIVLLEVILSPFVIIALATILDPLTKYFDTISSILSYLLILVGVGYAITTVL